MSVKVTNPSKLIACTGAVFVKVLMVFEFGELSCPDQFTYQYLFDSLAINTGGITPQSLGGFGLKVAVEII
jgi:hypothetical protein